MSDDPALLSRVRWRSRRGMMELDILLRRYLDQRWSRADDAERAAYLRLLDCEDTRLWPWLLGRERPEDAELDALIQRMRTLSVS